MAKKSTMQDIASLAGVSVSKVSHVFNKTATISDATKAKVAEAAKTLNYRPSGEDEGEANPIIAIIVPDVGSEFYSTCAAELVNYFDEKGFTSCVFATNYNKNIKADIVESIIGMHAAGVVFVGGNNDDELMTKLEKEGIPFVLADRYREGYSSVDFVNTDSMRQLVRMLHKNGRKSYLCLSTTTDVQNVKDRQDGLRLGFIDNGISESSYKILVDRRMRTHELTNSEIVMSEYIDTNGVDFDVLIASNDKLAIGAIKVLQKRGYRVPEDVWVTGYDDIPASRLITPALTTVHQDITQMSVEVVGMLCDKLANPDHRAKRILLENRLIMRESTQFAEQEA